MNILLRKISYLFVIALLLLLPQSVVAEKPSWDQLFEKNIHEWMDNISKHDSQFREWRQAKTEIHTLGANQHQWLVSLSRSGKQVGYMVIGEVMSSKQTKAPILVLLEYGVGEFILFDDTFAPKQVSAEPVYDGFGSYWRIGQNDTLHYVDAKTGERYPSTTQPDPFMMSTVKPDELASDGTRLTKTHTLLQTEVNPFDQIGWLPLPDENQHSSPISWQQLLQETEKKLVILNVSLFRDEVMAPFTVGSIHLWNDKTAYVGVWDEGLRFVPYAYADRVGTFLYNE